MPFLIPLIGLALGILIGYPLDGLLWGVLSFFLGLAYYLFLLKSFRNPLTALAVSKLHLIWIFLICFGVGIMDISFQKPTKLSHSLISSLHTAQGVVTDHNYSTSGDRFQVRIDYLTDCSGQKQSFPNLDILLYTDGLVAEAGDIITFPAKLNLITENPNYRSHGYAEQMRRKGLIYRSVAKTEDVKIIGHQNNFRSLSRGWRDKLIILLEKSSLERPTINFLAALLLGDQVFLTSETRAIFSNAGIAHVLALSGTHVAIIMGLIMFLLFPLNLIGLHRWKFVIVIAAIWFYAYLSGLAPSTVRACVMSTFVVTAILLQRKNAPGNALVASAFFILLFDPYAIFDIGMQLSFLCVASILIFIKHFNCISQHNHPLTYSLVNSLLISIVTTFSTWIVISYYFNSIPLLFLPANILLLPLLPFYMAIALIYLVLLVIRIDPSFLSFLLDKTYGYMSRFAEASCLYGTTTIHYRAHVFSVVLWLIGIGIIGYGLHSSNKKCTHTHSGKTQNIISTLGAFAMLLAIGIIPFLHSGSNDSIIFQKNYREINLALYRGEDYRIISLPRHSISTLHHKDNIVFSIDAPIDSVIIEKICRETTQYKNRFLIIGAGYKNGNLNDIPKLEEYKNIILHSSLRRKRENSILDEAKNTGLKNIHSLREKGPLTIDL